ncbi:hypothetical protein NDU88_004596 [Pleurodeles waltl]|uniref:Uncharacterized protein n=1 Tax=Pleurodeles waltl TaxID=8319 RepID=A0AAV7TRY9_PLEWA|nr:hypothetical protein NDU88_004596 [Pleurodeles waltl]
MTQHAPKTHRDNKPPKPPEIEKTVLRIAEETEAAKIVLTRTEVLKAGWRRQIQPRVEFFKGVHTWVQLSCSPSSPMKSLGSCKYSFYS